MSVSHRIERRPRAEVNLVPVNALEVRTPDNLFRAPTLRRIDVQKLRETQCNVGNDSNHSNTHSFENGKQMRVNRVRQVQRLGRERDAHVPKSLA